MYNEDSYNLKNIYAKILEYHNNNQVIGDLRPSNILANSNGEIEFIELSSRIKNNQEEQNKDIFKFFILAVAYYTNTTKEIEYLLKEDSNITDEDVKRIYRGHTKLYKDIRKITQDYENELNNKQKDSTDASNKNVTSKKLTKNNGHPTGVELNKPNAFISMILFPFVTIYLFFILALLYWMIVLS